MNENKFLLIKGSSGLGNRMGCALTGILYARLAGRKLLIDWSDDVYSHDRSNVFHRFFLCSLCSPTDEIPATDSVSPSIWRGHLQDTAGYMVRRYGDLKNRETWRQFSIDLTRLDYEEDVLVMWSHRENLDLLRNHYNGEFKDLRKMSKKAILRKLLREYLILHPEIQDRVDRFKAKYINKNTVGVHVRYTDHRASLWITLKKLDAILNREPGLQIFLATDNIQIKKIFEESYPGLISTPHWYPAPGVRLHGNRSCPDPIEVGTEALIDLYLLAECKYLIIDMSSSFSYVANLLTEVPDSHIFDVKGKEKLPLGIRRLSWQLMLRLGLFSWGLSILRKCLRIQRLLIRRL